MKKILLLFLCFTAISFSQEEVVQVQPSIMVLPYTDTGESAINFYEEKQEWKSIVATINKGIQDRGFKPKDLQETINQVKKNKGINTLKMASFNIEEELLQEARPDILIKAQINLHDTSSGISVQIILNAIEVSSRGVLATLPQISSPHFKTDDYGYLVKRLLDTDNALEGFLNDVNRGFGDTVANGLSITISIESPNEGLYKLDDEVTDDFDTVSDLIIEWVKKSAYKNQFKIGRTSEQTLYFDEVKIPLRDEYGNNYSINDYEKSLRKSIRRIIAKKDGKGAKFTSIVQEGTIKIVLP
ncbi:DUF6175 family protein [Winogradskyella helgolandensis]|uniref:DUF6175 family protein n=1 Tax=Winogradskyella helgolandensis TaxID=2697010 RepID=UPI0015C9A77E|nr:DUF6175 family protein [Winogradskyella helgolandensis]